ncbi:MAG: hypothetical protein M1813_007478 [Trichoglossum hirsutum]|nr:MAG: hypothetical protein M1813_007478 [Trichoglossum hirsutum]
MVLEVLHPVEAPGEISNLRLRVDIAAIHGLNGDPRTTFTNSTTEAFWLKDFLPLDVPGARVMNFGYNARAAFGNSVSRFEDHAKDLLGSLVDRRQRDDEIQRPLVFIAHSLGGIIVKQALVLARIDRKYQKIHEHTIGIIFLATPHRGSEAATYGNVLARVATSVTGGPGPSLTGPLRRNSTDLLRLTSDFKFEQNKFSVVSFYEQKPMGKMSTVIVDRSSALLEFEGEDQIPVDAHHRDICKFASRDDATYEKLFHRINRMVGESIGSGQWTNDDSGWTPLHKAAHSGVPADLRRLLDQGANVNAEDYDGMTPLHRAAAAGHDVITFILLKKGANVELQDDLGRTALHCAAENGQVAVVWELLVRKKVDVNAKNQAGKTALDCAIERQHDAVVWLFDHGPDITAKDGNGDTLLLWAAANGQEAVVQLLLNKGAKVTERNGDEATALHHAANTGNKAIAQLLLKNKAEIDARNKYDITPLQFAAMGGHPLVVRLLVDEGADVKAVDSLGRTALDLASASRHEAVAQLLWQHNNTQTLFPDMKHAGSSVTRLSRASTVTADLKPRSSKDSSRSPSSRGLTTFDSGGRSPSKETSPSVRKRSLDTKSEKQVHTSSKELFEAVKAGNCDAAEELLCEGDADIEGTDRYGATALHMASRRGDDAMVQLLTQLDADVNAKDRSGATALHVASRDGHEGVALLLIQSGVDIKAKNASSQTALHIASEHGHEATVKLLVDYGAHLDSRDRNGQTPLVLAASRGNEEVVRFLAANRAELDTDRVGETALHVAANGGHGGVVDVLLDSAIDINARNDKGLTALHIAASKGMEEVVRLLLKKRAVLEMKTDLGFTALHLSANNGHEAVTRQLISHGANIEMRCGDLGATALHYAAMSKNDAVVGALLDSGAFLEAQCDNLGATALHYAAMEGHLPTVSLLLYRGADARAKTKAGKRASHWARRPEHKEVMQLLMTREKEKKKEDKGKEKEREKEKKKEEKGKEKGKEGRRWLGLR